MDDNILKAFGFNAEEISCTHFGSGLINDTWLVKHLDKKYILQRVNNLVFKDPGYIAYNIRLISDFLKQVHPSYLFVSSVPTTDNEEIYFDPQKGFYRLMSFVSGSHTIDTVHSTKQAFEAARQFGLFTKMLIDFNPGHLKITLPDFHNLSLRHIQFTDSLSSADEKRVEEAVKEIEFLKSHTAIVEQFELIKNNVDFKIRVTHHDTKISNALFDSDDNGLCVIDLDTVMPGYFISDVGDMMRTYLSPVKEEETDFSKIEIRDEYFKAIAEGYIGVLRGTLTDSEIEHFVYAGKFMIYMQALRFLTDYLNNDVYYGAEYEKHNLVRTGNQIVLLQKLMEKEEHFTDFIRNYMQENPQNH